MKDKEKIEELKEYAKTVTKEEFLEEVAYEDFLKIDCPNKIGLESFDVCLGASCLECWEKAIKDENFVFLDDNISTLTDCDKNEVEKNIFLGKLTKILVGCEKKLKEVKTDRSRWFGYDFRYGYLMGQQDILEDIIDKLTEAIKTLD